MDYTQTIGALAYVVERICEGRTCTNFASKAINEHLFLRRWIATDAINQREHELYDEMMQLRSVADAESWRALTPAESANAWVAYYKRRGGRGGKREGSGRPSLGERKTVSIRIHEQHYAALIEGAKAAGVSQSKYIEDLLIPTTQD